MVPQDPKDARAAALSESAGWQHMSLQVEAEQVAAERSVEAPPPVLTYDAFRQLCLAHPLQVRASHSTAQQQAWR
jgi:hypothetical protein